MKNNMKRKTCVPIFLVCAITLFAACSSSSDSSTGPQGTGIGGSLARFAINEDNLYILSGEKLITYHINPNASLSKAKVDAVGSDSETLFSLGDILFVGASSGMRIFSINAQGLPLYESFYSHVLSCDPVVADTNYAYLTLNNQSAFRCSRGVNRLEIIDISNLKKPQLENFYGMTSPKGLAKDGNLLFVCDNQLKVYNAANVDSLKLLHTFPVLANDVIAYNGLLILTADNGLFQYNYDGANLTYLSSILKEF